MFLKIHIIPYRVQKIGGKHSFHIQTVFLKTAAEKIGDVFHINSRITAKTLDEMKRLENPWIITSAAFILEASGDYYVLLVERVPERKWALIPAGASNSVEELRQPGLALEREAQEELVIYRNGVRVCPLKISRLLTVEKIMVYDEANGETYVDVGEVWRNPRRRGEWFLMRCYLMLCDWRELIISDGEKDEETHEYLNRRVALVPINRLDGKVTPLAVYKGLRRLQSEEINLNGYQTPTLEWFRTRSQSYIKALQERC